VSGAILPCGCPFDYETICAACGFTRITNHCPHDGVQNRCPECGHLDPGKESPLEFIGLDLLAAIVAREVETAKAAAEGGQR
jgi:hypothetical protein